MINQDAKNALKNCSRDLVYIKGVLSHPGTIFRQLSKYLIDYSVIRAYGTIEFAFKCIIADFFEDGQSEYIKNFISNKVREKPINPEIGRIYTLIKNFDDVLHTRFKGDMNQYSNKDKLLSSLNSLRGQRHTLAHGGNITISFNDVFQYYKDSCIIIKILDRSLNNSDNFPDLWHLFS